MGAAAAVTVLGFASAASAVVLDVTFTGLTQAGNANDALGLFSSGGDLGNADFSLLFRIDTNLGTRTGNTEIQTDDGHTPPVSPVEFARLTINGHTVSTGIGFADFYSATGDTVLDAQASGDTARGFEALEYHVDFTGVTSIDQTFTEPTVGLLSLGLYQINNANNVVIESITLTSSSSITVDVAPADTGVPEPISWALMLVGFAGLGAMLRRRRALAAAV
jgi:hypothetical protein